MRHINEAGIAIIKRFEGLRLRAYRCPAGVWTIGYGSTGQHVKPGLAISETQADGLLRYDINRFERAVERAIYDVPTTDNQFSAMLSLAFNIGEGRFLTSSVLRLHRAGRYRLAAGAFLLFVKARQRGALRTLPGLVRRRNAERQLYLTPDPAPGLKTA